MFDFNQIAETMKAGRAPRVKALVQEALDAGIVPEDIVNNALIPAMSEIGEKFKNNEIYVPEVLIAARAMNAGLAILEPLLAQRDIKPAGSIAIGTVRGDLHDIGKNLVAMMLKGAGFRVVDLGVDVSPESFVEAARSENVDIIAMSALLTTTMPSMKATVDALKDAGLRDDVKVIIGGAPVTEAYSVEIGADGYSSDAASAAQLALRLVKGE